LRPAHQLVEVASQFDCKIDLIKDDLRIDAKSVLSILTLGAGPGSEVSFEGDGPDAQQAVDALIDLMEAGFDLTPPDGNDETGDQTRENGVQNA
jgi:phosphocarrier protein